MFWKSDKVFIKPVSFVPAYNIMYLCFLQIVGVQSW